MQLKSLLLISLLSLFNFSCAYSHTQNLDIQNLSKQTKVQTEVMILGSAHLSRIKEDLTEGELTPVISILENYQPTAIAIESLRPEDINSMLNGSNEYRTALTQFVGDKFLSLSQKEQKALGISAKEAINKLNQLSLSSKLSTEERIYTIRLAVAGYFKHTAVLHWKYLKDHSTISDISPELQKYLNERASSNSEINIIARTLAMKLELNRLHPIDSHLDKDIYSAVVSKLMTSYQNSKHVADIKESDYFKKPIKLQDQALKTGDWLPLFLWLNSKEYTSDVIDVEWSLFVNKDIETKPALSRIALWEIRNLNMTSNIMRVVSNDIGGRVIVIVGANHKIFLEQYLSNMIGIKIVQFSDIVAKYDK